MKSVVILAGIVALVFPSLAFTELAHAEEPAPSNEKAEVKESLDEPRSDTVDIGVLGGVGFPRPLAIEGVVGFRRTVMIGAEYSFLPTMTIMNVDTRLWAAAADFRVFPFRGAFFIGMRAGYQELTARGSVQVANVGSYAESIEVGTWFVNPRIGFLWTLKPFMVGIDAGVQIPVSSSFSRSSEATVAGVSVEADAQVTRSADSFGRTVLPTVDLLRVGLAF